MPEDKLHERVAKLEARTDNHENIIMKLREDIAELRGEINTKLDRVVDKALEYVKQYARTI